MAAPAVAAADTGAIAAVGSDGHQPDSLERLVAQDDYIRRKRIHAAPAHQPPPRQNCDPNYSGCLDPNASDYDCAGGSGNGPLYTAEVVVLGDDHYDLDADGDGTACEDD